MTYLSKSVVNATGSTTTFAVPFPYINKVHVKAKLGGVDQAFTWTSDSTISISPAPTGTLVIYRETPTDGRLVNFNDTVRISEDTLDLDSLQAFYIEQEIVDALADLSGEVAGIDLSDYYTKSEIDALLADIEAGVVDLSGYYTKTEVDALLEGLGGGGGSVWTTVEWSSTSGTTVVALADAVPGSRLEIELWGPGAGGPARVINSAIPDEEAVEYGPKGGGSGAHIRWVGTVPVGGLIGVHTGAGGTGGSIEGVVDNDLSANPSAAGYTEVTMDSGTLTLRANGGSGISGGGGAAKVNDVDSDGVVTGPGSAWVAYASPGGRASPARRDTVYQRVAGGGGSCSQGGVGGQPALPADATFASNVTQGEHGRFPGGGGAGHYWAGNYGTDPLPTVKGGDGADGLIVIRYNAIPA